MGRWKSKRRAICGASRPKRPRRRSVPKRFFKPTPGGALKDKRLSFAEMERMKRYCYDLMGWDEKGALKAEKLEELGIEEWQ
jgi:aldehyde:ferredoxin oxidoreductase